MCQYERQFNKFLKVFKDEHFCNDVCWGRNITIDPVKDAIFVAMVGPPARGKSATFAFLQQYFANYNRSVYLFNAGDYRRVWEKQVKRIYKTNVDAFIKMCYDKKLTEPNALQPYRLALMKWLKSKQSAIPGDIFGAFKSLNNEFAMVCIRDAMKYMEKNKVVVFDATNTDISRRETIMNVFATANQPSKKLLFIENICFDEKQLKENFLSKLLESSDYKNEVKNDCAKQIVRDKLKLSQIIHKIIEKYDLLELPCQQVNTTELNECEHTVIASMQDITTRDSGYLKKYVPLHVAQNGLKSTIYSIRRNKRKDIGYIQLINSVCLRGKHLSIYKTNLKQNDDKSSIAEYLASVKITDIETLSSYGQNERIAVNVNSLTHLL